MKTLFLFTFVTFVWTFMASFASIAKSKESVQKTILADLVKDVSQYKTPQEVLAAYGKKVSSEDKAYLQLMIDRKLWVEIPKYRQDGNDIVMSFSNSHEIRFEIQNYFSKEFKLNGQKLEAKTSANVTERIAYLRKQVAPLINKNSTAQSKWKSFFSLVISEAQASMTCNILVSTGCLEVSVATTLWMVEVATDESPMRRCKEIYYFDRYKDTTKFCLDHLGDSPTLSTVQEISELLAETPDTSLRIACRQNGGPEIIVNDEEVTRLGAGLVAEDYSVPLEMNPEGKLSRLPELAIRCCERASGDPLAGQCEDFVNSQVGKKEKRKEKFSNPDLRIRGKELRGVR